MMKKLIATALAAAMIFGLVSVALAAGFSDIDDHARKNDILKLVSLGIIDGYPDGTFKPENPVTRAEFAKLIVTTMGLGDAAKLMAGVVTPFSDVPATHWASGYINLAHSQDIVNGYPDGTFKPSGNVTYAEALKMVLCALGYTEDLIKPIYWPVTWIARAVNVGLTKGVDVSPNLAAPRGEIAALLENSLTIDKVIQVGLGDKQEFQVKEGETFLKALVGSEPVIGILAESPELFTVDDDTIWVDDGSTLGKSFDVVNIEDVKGLLGHRVKVWANSAGEVLFVEDLSTVKSGEYDLAEDAFYVGTTKISSSVPWIRNYGLSGVLAESDEVTVVYDGSKPIYVIALGYTTGVVSNVSTLYESIAFSFGSPVLTLKKVDVIFNGDASALKEIQKDDVVQYIANADKAILFVTRNAFTGKFSRLSSDDVVTVGGRTLTGYYNESYLGSNVKVLLDKDGDIAYMVEAGEDEVSQVAIVLDAWYVPTKDGKTYYAKMLLADGSKATFEVTSSVYGKASFVKGAVIEYALDDDDVVDSVSFPLAALNTEGLAPVKKHSLVNDVVVTPSTAIFKQIGDDASKWTVLTFADLTEYGSTLTGYLVDDGASATLIVVTAGDFAVSSATWGVVADLYKTSATKAYVSILSDGSVSDYVYAGSGLAEKDVVTYKVSGDTATEVNKPGADYESDLTYDLRVASIDGNLVTVKLYHKTTGVEKANSTVRYLVDADTQYVDLLGSTPKALDALYVGAKVAVYTGGVTIGTLDLATLITVVK